MDDEACQPEFNPRRGQLAACTRQGSFRAGILAQELRGSLVNIDQINKEQQEGALSSLRVITSEAFGVALSKTYRFKLMVTDFLENDSEEVTKQLVDCIDLVLGGGGGGGKNDVDLTRKIPESTLFSLP